jgi:hypothetical protein
MSSRRVRPIRFVLVALALLLPGAVGAQSTCCNSEGDNGNDCSACCYADPTLTCTFDNVGSGWFPSCTCGSSAGGGGGGCADMTLSSRTLSIGSDRGPELAGHQLRFGLQQPRNRPEGSFIFEEWALVSSAADKAKVLGASTGKFAGRVQAVAERFLPRGTDTSIVLVIEEAEHPHNSREIPIPEVAPIDFDAGLPASEAGQEAWFRAEVGKDGVVDQVILLNRPEAFASFTINHQLREHLSLRYADKRRHRAVVFGLVRADVEGHLVMKESLVVLPTCCCLGRHCV